MNRQNLRVVDTGSGEVLADGMFVYVSARKRTKERFFMGFMEAFEGLAADKALRGAPLTVFTFLLSRLDWENYIAVQQQDIAAKLDMHRVSVTKALGVLVKKGVLLRGPDLGRSASFRLNPHYGWRGSIVNLEEARRAHVKLAIDNSVSAAADALRDTLTRDMFERGS